MFFSDKEGYYYSTNNYDTYPNIPEYGFSYSVLVYI